MGSLRKGLTPAIALGVVSAKTEQCPLEEVGHAVDLVIMAAVRIISCLKRPSQPASSLLDHNVIALPSSLEVPRRSQQGRVVDLPGTIDREDTTTLWLSGFATLSPWAQQEPGGCDGAIGIGGHYLVLGNSADPCNKALCTSDFHCR